MSKDFYTLRGKRQREGTRQGDISLRSDNPPAIFMKTKRKSYKQRSKRKNARWKDNNEKYYSVFTWSPNKGREYIIVDNKTGKYISNEWSAYSLSIPTSVNVSCAHTFDNINNIIRVLTQIKHTGAWRTIRIK